MNRRTGFFFVLVGAAPIATALAAATLVVGAIGGHHVMWRATDADLVSAIRNHSPVAVKVFVEALPSIDTPVPFSHPRILNSRQLEVAPLVIALVQGHEDIVEILRKAGSDPVKALGQMPRETASALLAYAIETRNAVAIEYLTTYRINAAGPDAVPPIRAR
jgi:hypothetical protein